VLEPLLGMERMEEVEEEAVMGVMVGVLGLSAAWTAGEVEGAGGLLGVGAAHRAFTKPVMPPPCLPGDSVSATQRPTSDRVEVL